MEHLLWKIVHGGGGVDIRILKDISTSNAHHILLLTAKDMFENIDLSLKSPLGDIYCQEKLYITRIKTLQTIDWRILN